MMLVRTIAALWMSSLLATAQDRPAAAIPQPGENTCLVLGAVTHLTHTVRGGRKHEQTAPTLRTSLTAPKPRPHADTERIEVLRGARHEFAVVSGRATDLAGLRIHRGDIILVPRMANRRDDALVDGKPPRGFQALSELLRMAWLRAASPKHYELAARLYLLRCHPDAGMRRSQAKQIVALDADAVPALPALRGMHSPEFADVRHLADGMRRQLSRAALRGVCTVDCFPGATVVDTPTGPRAIEDLRAGDRVLDGTGRTVRVAGVRRGFSNRLIELSVAGHTVRATRGHRILTPGRGLVAAEKLRAADRVVTATGPASVRLRTRSLPDPVSVYTLALEGDASTFRVGATRIVVAAANGAAVR